jgi:hypothetical protein
LLRVTGERRADGGNCQSYDAFGDTVESTVRTIRSSVVTRVRAARQALGALDANRQYPRGYQVSAKSTSRDL